jgi:hypothetical protein
VYHEIILNCGWLKFFISVRNKALYYFQPYLDRHDEDAKIDFENKRKLADVVIDEYPELPLTHLLRGFARKSKR